MGGKGHDAPIPVVRGAAIRSTSSGDCGHSAIAVLMVLVENNVVARAIHGMIA
jgi:hypothetical protein